MNIQFNKITPRDINKIANLQPDGWSDITREFRIFDSNNFCYPIKMVVDNEIVGVGNAVVFENSAWLSHIIVGKENRNRGYGFYIVEYLLNYLKSKPIETVLLIASPFGEGVYKKFGFRTVSNYSYLERKNAWTTKEISEKVVPYESRFYKEIIRLDKEISGEEREPLLKKYIQNSFVYIERGEVTGFYIPSLGEGQIFADTPDAGIELMSMKYATNDIAILPEDNKIGLDFLKKNGFGLSATTGKRMILGKDIHWQAHKFYSRISGDYG